NCLIPYVRRQGIRGPRLPSPPRNPRLPLGAGVDRGRDRKPLLDERAGDLAPPVGAGDRGPGGRRAARPVRALPAQARQPGELAHRIRVRDLPHRRPAQARVAPAGEGAGQTLRETTMHALIQPTSGFPMARIPSRHGGPPIEACLVAQLSPGDKDRLFASASGHQRGHASFVDALDEPSARLFGIDPERGERSAVYSFAVDAGGHPFHRHAGHRVFTAVSGSGGAHLRFSTIDDDALRSDPRAFLDSLHVVDIPPDSLFTVRFAGGTWHQFAPRRAGSPHPVFFALSCHTDEVGGIVDAELAAVVRRGEADIPTLTELLPQPVQRVLDAQPFQNLRVAATTLSLHAAPGTLALRACARIRESLGHVRRRLAGARIPAGFIGLRHRHAAVAQAAVADDSLLARQFIDGFHHQDLVALLLPADADRQAQALLADVLEGFLANRPAGVSWLMRLRNVLVRPLRLRRSPL